MSGNSDTPGTRLARDAVVRAMAMRNPEWSPESAWHMHVPFAFLCMDLLRPRLFVELGTQAGVSYCAFCAAADQLGIEAQGRAVDHWKGDEHTGAYASDTYLKLSAHHDPRYGRFSRLMKMSFDEALPHFEDGTIDLLHIDGFHTYEAVRHDFDSWAPRLSRAGVVLMHDVEERQRDFGVWRLWDELRSRYPTLTFPFGHGLGVAAVGPDVPEAFLALCRLDAPGLEILYRGFEILGDRTRLLHLERTLRAQLEQSQTEGAHAYQVYLDLRSHVERKYGEHFD